MKLAIATSHAMQVFNDLHYSNRCRFILYNVIAGILGEVVATSPRFPARLKAHPELRTLLITKESGYEAA